MNWCNKPCMVSLGNWCWAQQNKRSGLLSMGFSVHNICVNIIRLTLVIYHTTRAFLQLQTSHKTCGQECRWCTAHSIQVLIYLNSLYNLFFKSPLRHKVIWYWKLLLCRRPTVFIVWGEGSVSFNWPWCLQTYCLTQHCLDPEACSICRVTHVL